ncbi:MAG TPA: ATP-grasp domain-containing protein [Pirellulales bacterium]|nr:ATP-grasp domain-containing protein [Pirellulales bacterium]
MRFFVYEYLSGGGLLSHEGPGDGLQPLLAEGRAMCRAVAADLAQIEGAEVTCLRDARQSGWQPEACRCVDVRTRDEHDRAFDCYAAQADWTLVIAPEIGGALAERCRRVRAVGGRPLTSPPRLIELASDKHATAEHLRQSGVPAPRGIPFKLGETWPRGFSYPAIWKPLDGAGSQGLRYVEHSDVPVPPLDGRAGRLEEFHPWPNGKGDQAASVAFLCGPQACIALPPCTQRLDPAFHYLGGRLPLPASLAQRATHLALRAIRSLSEPLGYLGVDLALGTEADGSADVVIEVNPRLTTSYIGLRAVCRENLAEAMLAIATGRPYNLTFREELVEFTTDGCCILSPGDG